MALLSDVIQRDTRANQPAASAVAAGTIFYVTDENVTERSTGSAWEDISDSGSGGGSDGWTVVLKESDETKNSDTSLAEDAELVVALTTNDIIAFEFMLFADVDTTPDIDWRLTGPASPTSIRFVEEANVSVGSGPSPSSISRNAYHTVDQPVQSSFDTGTVIWVRGMVQNGSNTGNLAISWAQRVSDAGDTTVLAGSWLQYRKV